MNSEDYRNRPPHWFTAIVLVLVLPEFLWPVILGDLPGTEGGSREWIMILFPAYIMASSWIAYKSYVHRPEVSWVLLVVELLCYGAVLML